MKKLNKKTLLFSVILGVIIIILIIGGIKQKNRIEQEKQEQVQIQEQINKQKDIEKLEQENIVIDEYNFKELEKAKPILENIPKDDYKFYSLKKFNEKYKSGIKPIKNCYYVSNDNGNELYIFGFKLESEKYKNEYGTGYYVYPKYDIPIHILPGMGGGDENYYYFLKTISIMT